MNYSNHQRKTTKSDNELVNEATKNFPNYPVCFFNFTETDNPRETAKTIEQLKEFVKKNAAQNISTSQVRNLYAKARALSNETELQLLRPQIAYMIARSQKKTDEVKQFFLLLDDLITKGIKLPASLKVFEAIVAYHKYYGGGN